MIKHVLVVSLISFLFVSCNQEVEITELEFEDSNILSGANKAQSIQAYKESVYPIVRKNCVSCHGDGGSNINFASENPEKGHDLLVDSGKVNLSLATQSRLYLRLKDDLHNCWGGGDCETASDEMLTALKAWLANIYKENAGVETGSIAYSDGTPQLPKTVRGSIVFEAEDAISLNPNNNTNPDSDFLQGRYLVNHNAGNNKDSYASGLKYVSGYTPSSHPFEGTGRAVAIAGIGSNATACETIEDGININSNTAGRVRNTEAWRHPNQDGHIPYASSMRYQIINPVKRAEYKTLLTNSPDDADPALLRVENYFIITGELEDGMYDGNPLGATTPFMLLPDYKTAAEYSSEVSGSNSDYSTKYFAPRFGTPATSFFQPTNKELRINLTDSQKTIIYNSLRASLRGLVLRGDGTARLPSEVLPMIKEMDFPGKGERKYGLLPGQSRTILQGLADDYVSYFYAGMTNANVLDYVVVYTDINSRQRYPNVTNNGTGNVSLVTGDPVTLDNSSIFASSSVDYREIAVKHYKETVHKVQRSNVCINCHSGAGPGPGHSNPDAGQAYDLAGSHINLGNPMASNFYDRMKNQRHRCGSNAQCDAIADSFVTEMTTMNNLVSTEYAAALANPTFVHDDLTASQRSPGRIKIPFYVTEAGDYSLWTRTRRTGNFRVRLLTENNQGVQRCRAGDSNCQYADERGYSLPSACVNWDKPDSQVWEWYTENYDDPANRMVWRIKPGKYILEVIESETGAVFPHIDLLAFSKDTLFDPSTNIADEALVQGVDPRELKYDISDILGEPGFFTIEVDRFGGDSYRFRNPRIVGNNSNVIVSGISVSISDVYSKSNTSYNDIDFIAGTTGEPITNASLLAQEIFGTGSDTFKFSFELIKASTGSESQIPKEDLTPFNNRVCAHLDQFEKTIFPILTKFKLVYRHEEDGDNTYNFYKMPGDERAEATSMQFFTCTSCHNEDHPYFKMTTFFDRSDTATEAEKKAGMEKFCSQALSRVKFDSPATSLLLRGFEGKANHKRLHIVQEATPTKSGNYYTGYQAKTNSIDGYRSVWRGIRFQKYSAADLNLSSYSGANRAYLEQYEGLYKIYRYNRINDPLAVNSDGDDRINGDIMTNSDDSGFVVGFDEDGNTLHMYPDENNSPNKYYVFNPINELAKAANDRFNPASIVATGENNNNKILMKDGCQNAEMDRLTNGLQLDQCNGDVDTDKEFDEVKGVYRDVILNWINREKASGGY